jgi:hypothetical protein
MAGVTLTRTLAWQGCAGLALCLLGTVALEGMPRKATVARPVNPPAHARAIKRTWHNGPATMPLEVEVVPPHSSFPPSVTKQAIRSEGGQKAAVGLQAGVPMRAVSVLAAKPGPALAVQTGIATVSTARAGMSHTDPEVRARDELRCLGNDPSSRQAFYDDLRRNVERVRRGEEDASPDEKKPIACPPSDRAERLTVQ